MSNKNFKNTVMLLLTAIIWGSAFVAQSVGMDYIGPFTFNCVRSILGGVVLIPCIAFLKRIKNEDEQNNNDRKTLVIGGVWCGVVLFAASSAQQIGIQYTSVGKAGFITALYIVMVPIAGIFLKKKCSPLVWAAVVIALGGFYLLSVKDGFALEPADIYLLVSSFLFTIHILVIDYFSPKVDGVKMSCIQFFVCGILCAVMMFLVEEPEIKNIVAAAKPIGYAGIMSCGVAYTLQILGQKNYNPTIASLILSLESVFSVLAGWLILNQALSARELLGCVLIFVAIILAQVPVRKKGAK